MTNRLAGTLKVLLKLNLLFYFVISLGIFLLLFSSIQWFFCFFSFFVTFTLGHNDYSPKLINEAKMKEREKPFFETKKYAISNQTSLLPFVGRQLRRELYETVLAFQTIAQIPLVSQYF